MALPFQRPAAGVATGHSPALIQMPRSVPLVPQGTATARPLIPAWLVPARSGIGSAFALAHKRPLWGMLLHVTDKLLTVGDLARMFQVDPKTAGRWCAQGRVPGAFRTPGGHWRIPQPAIDKLLRKET